MIVLSLQSGTSMDGIDVAIVEFTRTDSDKPWHREGEANVSVTLDPLHCETVPWTTQLRSDIQSFSADGTLSAGQVCKLDNRLGRAFAAAAKQALENWTKSGPGLASSHSPIDLVVSHGQTVFHWDTGPDTGTLQLGQPAWISEALETSVISNLRAPDIAAGGQGAPLMRVFDQFWLGSDTTALNAPIATLNLGGIGNLQVIYPERASLAFDTGPGNALLDEFIELRTGAAYDADGKVAASGTVSQELLSELLEHPYFAKECPKSTGRETFNAEYVSRALAKFPVIDTADLMATLTELTAVTVITQVPLGVSEIICSGGGTKNSFLMERLAALAQQREMAVRSSADLGVDPEFKESLMFALVGFLAWHRIPITLGSHPARIGGQTLYWPGAGIPNEQVTGITGLIVKQSATNSAFRFGAL